LRRIRQCPARYTELQGKFNSYFFEMRDSLAKNQGRAGRCGTTAGPQKV
jgi:hypothetical protein